MWVFEVSTYDVEALRLTLWFATVITVNLFFLSLKLLGFEITRGEPLIDFN